MHLAIDENYIENLKKIICNTRRHIYQKKQVKDRTTLPRIQNIIDF